MLEKFLISIGLKQPEYVEDLVPENTRTVRPSSENRFENEDYSGDLKIHQPKDEVEIKDDLFKKFPESTIEKQSKKYLDLSKEIERFCIEKNIDFENSSICTIGSDSFNSYRRDNTELRQWSIAWI